MKVFFCKQCLFAFDVVGDTDELALMTSESIIGATCPSCDAVGAVEVCWEAELGVELRRVHRRHLTATEAYAALMGLGLPVEDVIPDAEELAELLRSGVEKVVGKRGPDRFVIDHIKMVDGTRVFFAAAAEGAIIYRVGKPVSYVELATRSKE